MSSDGLRMFLSVHILANVRPLFEILVGLFVVLIVFVQNADVNVKTAGEGMIFAKGQFRQFHHSIVKLLLFRAPARG